LQFEGIFTKLIFIKAKEGRLFNKSHIVEITPDKLLQKSLELYSINVVNIIPRARVIAVDVTPELDVIIEITPNEIHGFVDLNGLWKLSIGLQIPGFVS